MANRTVAAHHTNRAIPRVRASRQRAPGGPPHNGAESPEQSHAGNGGQSKVGGGGASGPGGTGSEPGKDGSQPSPKAEEPPTGNNEGDNVAPGGTPQGGLNIRKLADLLKDENSAKQLENRSGITREQFEQYVSQFKKQAVNPPAGPGREFEAKPGEQTPGKPSADLPGLPASVRIPSKTVRNPGTMPQDRVRDNLEGPRFNPPVEWRGKWERYQNKLAKVVAPQRGSAAPPSPKP